MMKYNSRKVLSALKKIKISWGYLIKLAGFGTLISISMALLYYFIIVFAFSQSSFQRDLAFPVVNSWYLNSFLNDKNTKENPKSNDRIVIIDIDDHWFTRGNFAYLLEKTLERKPSVIGIDFTFEKEDGYDDEDTNRLVKTLKQAAKTDAKIILAAYQDNDNLIQSFFTDSIAFPYGIVNQNSLDSLFHFNLFYNNDKTKPKFATAIAQSLGTQIDNISDLIINFRAKGFTPIKIQDTSYLEYKLSFIPENSIVLMGEKGPNDIFSTPFVMNNGFSQLYGIELMAYQLDTILAKGEKNKSKYHRPFTELSFPLNIILVLFCFFVLNLIYLFFQLLFRSLITDKCNKEFFLWIISFTEVLILFLCELGILMLCYYLTDNYSIIPNVVFLFLMALVIDRGNSLAEKIINH